MTSPNLTVEISYQDYCDVYSVDPFMRDNIVDKVEYIVDNVEAIVEERISLVTNIYQYINNNKSPHASLCSLHHLISYRISTFIVPHV